MILNESGIRLPKNAKSAKICTHSDADGFFSALLLYHQLIRQGIDKDRINIEFVQYGDRDLLDKAARKNRFQALLSSDFSAYDKIDMKSSWNAFARSLDVEKNAFVYPTGKATYENFRDYVIKAGKPITYNTIASWLSKYSPDCLLFKKRSDSSVRISYENFIKGWKSYKGDDNVVVTDFDYTSDHHDNSKGNLVPGKSGKIGASYRSDTEHIATVSAQNLMNWEDIEIISRIDSATYKNIKDTIFMTKDFKSEGRMERLGILTSALVNQIIKNNHRLAEQLIKMSTPSIVSVYNNALKISKINDDEMKVISLLSKKDVDWNEVNSILENIPRTEREKLLKKRDDNKIKPIQNIDVLRNKNLKNIEREKVISKSDFKFHDNVVMFKPTIMKDQPSRYLFAFMKKDEKSPAFIIKELRGIGSIQVAASPFISQKDKERIDLGEICGEVIKSAYESGIIKKSEYENFMNESGGHKTIYNIKGFDMIGNTILSPNDRYRLKYIKGYEERRKQLSKLAVKKALDKGYSSEIEKYNNKKKEGVSNIYDYISDNIIKMLNSKYKDIAANPDYTIDME